MSRVGERLGFPVRVLAATYAAVTALQITTWTSPTTYAGTSGLVAAGTALGGLAPMVAGWALWRVRPSLLIGPLAVVLGAAWLAPVWVGWDGGNPVVRSIAMVVAPFVPVVALHLTVSVPPPMRPPARRWVLGVCWALTCAYTAARALVHDPIRDLGCWSNCADNVFVAFTDPDLARSLDRVWAFLSAALLLLSGALALVRLTQDATGVRRWILASAAMFTVCTAGFSLLPLAKPEDPTDPAFRALFWGGAASMTALGVAVASLARTEWRRTHAVARLADTLDAEPGGGGIERVLSEALGDPGLEVVFRLPGTGRIVDRDGRPACEDPGVRAEVPIVRAGEILAVVRGDAERWGTIDLEAEIGAVVRLAIDNERLRAGRAAQLAELRESRLRVMARADAERRRLERNLHDGAQQALLAVIFELGPAASEVRGEGDDVLAADLAGACDEARTAIEELRQLAQGIYPTVLTDAGLEAALRSLADQTDARLDLRVPARCTPSATERMAYLVVEYGIAQAVRRGVQAVAVDVRLVDEGPLRITVDPCCSRPGPEILDRVGTIGGRIDVTDGTLHAEVPCV